MRFVVFRCLIQVRIMQSPQSYVNDARPKAEMVG